MLNIVISLRWDAARAGRLIGQNQNVYTVCVCVCVCVWALKSIARPYWVNKNLGVGINSFNLFPFNLTINRLLKIKCYIGVWKYIFIKNINSG